MAEAVIFTEEALTFVYSEEFGCFLYPVAPAPFSLTVGESYRVVWGDVTYDVTAIDTSSAMAGTVAIGNCTAYGLGGNDEPFAIVASETDVTFISLVDTEATTRSITVYRVTEEDEEYLIWGSTLKGIANAIRAKNGTTGEIAVADMATKIAGITGGGGSGSSDVVIGTVIASGECGESATWQLDENGVLFISGEGAMVDYASGTVPWRDYRSQITTLVVEHGITSIGDRTCHGCSALTDVIIPDSVTSIGENAFYECTSLASITFPDSLTSIGDFAFRQCAFTSITIPGSVQTIGKQAFVFCTSMTSVVIQEGVLTIGDYAFNQCQGLTDIIIPRSVTSIGIGAFNNDTALVFAAFKNTSGWWVSTDASATSGTTLTTTNMASTAKAATYLTSTYLTYYWKRS